MKSNNYKIETVRVVIVGHVDHGKSTLIGRLMHDLNQIKEGRYEELKKVSEKRGTSFEWAFLMDALQTERNQGITIDTTQIFFKTKKRNYIFIDAPGHREFLRNMITGASSADFAILIVDAEEGVKEQTKKHGYLLKLLGITDIIVVLNKMDKINYDKKKFFQVKEQIKSYLKLIDIQTNVIIPVSAREGENINNKSSKMKWYTDTNVVNAIDNYKLVDLSSNNLLRLPVQDVYKMNDKRIIVGKIENGSLRVGDVVSFSPTNVSAKIKTIEIWNSRKNKANAGECVGFTLDEEIFIEKGHVVSLSDSTPKLVNSFDASIFWLSNNRLDLEKSYFIKINTAKYKVSFEKINKVIETDDLSQKDRNYVLSNEVAEVTIRSQLLIPVDNFSQNPNTGRFSILDGYYIVGGGIINVDNYPDQRITDKVNQDIVPTNFFISEAERTARLKHRPGIIWFTGLSGSGKSTIAKEIEKRLFIKKFNIFVLDGDNLRLGLNKDLDFSPDGRMENIRRIAEVAALFTNAGFLVITSLISPYRSERKKARAIKPEIFREVFIKSSLEKCIERDVKGLYSKAKKGKIKDFTGLSAPYEEPKDPELTIDTELEKLEDSVSKLENFIISEFGIL